METIVGINAVGERLAAGGAGVHRLLLREGKLSERLAAVETLARQQGVPVSRVAAGALDTLSDLAHQGVALEVDPPRPLAESHLDALVATPDHDLLILALDGVTDPRNLGACLRSAATLGVDVVIVPKDNSASLNAAAIKTAVGGASIVPLVEVTNLARTLERLQKSGVWVVGTLLETEKTLEDTPLTGHLALVMGSEGRGLRQNTIKRCDFLARIPMANDALGFNVAVATGICLYEAHRQRSAGS